MFCGLLDVVLFVCFQKIFNETENFKIKFKPVKFLATKFLNFPDFLAFLQLHNI